MGDKVNTRSRANSVNSTNSVNGSKNVKNAGSEQIKYLSRKDNESDTESLIPPLNSNDKDTPKKPLPVNLAKILAKRVAKLIIRVRKTSHLMQIRPQNLKHTKRVIISTKILFPPPLKLTWPPIK